MIIAWIIAGVALLGLIICVLIVHVADKKVTETDPFWWGSDHPDDPDKQDM